MIKTKRRIFPILIVFISFISLSYAQDDEASLRKQIAQDKNDYISMTKLGMICQQKVNKKEAIILFRKAIELNPDYPPPHLFLGRIYFMMQKTGEAIRELELYRGKARLTGALDERAKEIHINDLLYISDIYFTLKDQGRAKEVIDEVVELDPSNQIAYYNMGVYYYTHEHSRSRAYQNFTKAIELNPSNSVAKNAKFAIEFMRSNPDSRFAPDMSFINKEYRD